MTASTGSTLRLSLSDTFGKGPLDGAWWPHSRDLASEVADLVDHFPADRGHLMRLLYSPPDWDAAPRRIAARRGWVKLGGFPKDDTHLMVVLLSSTTRLRLLLIPPGTDPDHARALMASAAATGNEEGAPSLLGLRSLGAEAA